MTLGNSFKTSTAVLTLFAASLLAGCGSGESESEGAASTSPSASATASSTPTPTPTPTPEPVVATCDNTITPDALAALQAEGYTGQARDEGWLAGAAVEGGISCQWMVDHSIGTDNFIWLAWGPLDAAQSEAAIAALLADGTWVREDAAEGVYITTANGDMMPVTDENGYSTTYLFTDGQVKFAGTKAELAIVAAPEGFAP